MRKVEFLIRRCFDLIDRDRIPIDQIRRIMYDIIIRDGLILEGSGGDEIVGDLAISGDRISKISSTVEGSGKIEISANGRAVAPGFIDIHSHSEDEIMVDPKGDNLIRQGVTTVVSGNCGSSP